MPLLQWNNELSVGISSIDEQHKKLINMINALNDELAKGQPNDVLVKIFDGLAVYTVDHFGYEENLFSQYGYGESEAHKKEHIALIKQVGNLQEKMEKGDFMIGVEVMVFLKEWLLNHILKSDKSYAPFLIAKGVT